MVELHCCRALSLQPERSDELGKGRKMTTSALANVQQCADEGSITTSDTTVAALLSLVPFSFLGAFFIPVLT